MTERRQAETAPGLIPDHIKRGWPWLVAFLLSGAFFAQTFVASSDNSLTWDEPTFIASGYAYWKWGAFEVNPSHPPLLQMLQALPLVARQVPEVAFAPVSGLFPNPRDMVDSYLYLRSDFAAAAKVYATCGAAMGRPEFFRHNQEEAMRRAREQAGAATQGR